jgi:hypothetical protein
MADYTAEGIIPDEVKHKILPAMAVDPLGIS